MSGQSLTLRLAKSGYTVFPFMPIAAAPSACTAPVSAPLSALLLAWSGVQKRLRTRDPNHTGAVVPVVIDDSGDAYLSAHTYPHSAFPPSPPKRGGRFAHAGDTVRHYCRENGLTLVAIVCAAPSTGVSLSKHDLPSPLPLSLSRPYPLIPGVTDSGLAHADEEALIALYRALVLEPIAVIRALGDMLAAPRGVNRVRGRVLFVESTSMIDDSEPGHVFSGQSSPARMIAAARAETARLLRTELGPAGIDVCEIAVGESLGVTATNSRTHGAPPHRAPALVLGRQRHGPRARGRRRARAQERAARRRRADDTSAPPRTHLRR